MAKKTAQKTSSRQKRPGASKSYLRSPKKLRRSGRFRIFLFAGLFALVGGVIALIFALAAPGDIHWVATNGTANSACSQAQPCSLTHALSGANGAITAGETVHVRGGTYSTSTSFTTTLNGTSSSPITFRSAPGEQAILENSNQDRPVLEIYRTGGSYTIWRDFVIRKRNAKRTSTVEGSNADVRGDGVTVQRPGVKIINNIILDAGTGVGGGANADGSAVDREIYGNVILYSGYAGPDRGYHHGMYVQNGPNVTRDVIENNIVGNSFGLGMQLYGSEKNSYQNKMTVTGNTVFNAGHMSPRGTEMSILLGGGKADRVNNPVMTNNYTYAGRNSMLGYTTRSTAGCRNATLENNYMARPGNLVMEVGGGGSCTFSVSRNNTFIGSTTGVPNTGGSNTTTNNKPTSNPAPFIRPNKYESGRANVTIYNWTNSNSVAVNFSSFLSNGKKYAVYDAQNILGSPIASGTYNGGTVSIPMTSTAVTPVYGTVSKQPVHTPKEFGVFVVKCTDCASTSSIPNATKIGSELKRGQCLLAGQYIEVSPNAEKLIMQGDGNLVLYSGALRGLWGTGTNGKNGNRTCLQSDGNFVMYTADNKAVWASNTYGTPVDRVAVVAAGIELQSSASGQQVTTFWTSKTRDRLQRHEALAIGQVLLSSDGRYRLQLQSDGNLVLYNSSLKPIWASNTGGNSNVRYAAFNQNDGRLRLYGASQNQLWISPDRGFRGTSTEYANAMVMQSDGNLVIYTNKSRAVWASDTPGK